MKLPNILVNIIFLSLIGSMFSGCVGSPAHSTIRYNSVQREIARNNENLLELKVGLGVEEVRAIMGSPERSEGYEWGSVWLYRTAMTSGIYGTTDSDFTPLVFDSNRNLVGWGRNFFTEHVRRYEVEVR